MCKKIETSLEVLFDIIEEKLSLGGEVSFSPGGISMLPLIRPKCDKVTLKRHTENLKKNDIAFYKRKNGQFVLHRVAKKPNGECYVMCGDNQWLLEKGVESNQIIAVVSKIERDGKVVDFCKTAYRLYCTFLPFRRVWLKYNQKGILPRGIRKIKRILNKHPKR